MYQIYDGREHFYQWDLNQKLIVSDPSITEVHFCNKTGECALVCEVYDSEGLRLVNVPNILFQSDWRIKVWAYCGDYTKHEATFKVASRTKPADYIYTETEVKRYEVLEEQIVELDRRVSELAAGGGGGVVPTALSQLTNDMGFVGVDADGLFEVHSRQIEFYTIDGISVNGSFITNLSDPVSPTDAANKSYVDGITGDINTALEAIITAQNSIIGGVK